MAWKSNAPFGLNWRQTNNNNSTKKIIYSVNMMLEFCLPPTFDLNEKYEINKRSRHSSYIELPNFVCVLQWMRNRTVNKWNLQHHKIDLHWKWANLYIYMRLDEFDITKKSVWCNIKKNKRVEWQNEFEPYVTTNIVVMKVIWLYKCIHHFILWKAL